MKVKRNHYSCKYDTYIELREEWLEMQCNVMNVWSQYNIQRKFKKTK